MATLDQVKAEIQDVALAVAAEATEVKNAIQALKAQIAAGGEVTHEDLDGLIVSLESIRAGVSGIITPDGGGLQTQGGGGPGEPDDPNGGG